MVTQTSFMNIFTSNNSLPQHSKEYMNISPSSPPTGSRRPLPTVININYFHNTVFSSYRLPPAPSYNDQHTLTPSSPPTGSRRPLPTIFRWNLTFPTVFPLPTLNWQTQGFTILTYRSHNQYIHIYVISIYVISSLYTISMF